MQVTPLKLTGLKIGKVGNGKNMTWLKTEGGKSNNFILSEFPKNFSLDFAEIY